MSNQKMPETQEESFLIERRMKKSQLERNLRRFQMFVNTIRGIIGFCVALAIIYGVYKFAQAPGWYIQSDIFDKVDNNPRVEFEGNLVTSNYKIISVLRQIKLPEKPIYLIDVTEIEQAISELAPIDKAYIRRFAFPARFVIRVEEKIPVLTISPNEKVKPVAFFTSCGKLIGRDYLPLPKEYPTYLVLSYGIKGDDYHLWNEHKVKSIVSLAKEIEKLSGEKIVYLDLRNPKDVYIKLKSALVRIGEMDETVFNRIRNIGVLLPKISELKNKKIKYVDLRWETSYLKLETKKYTLPETKVKLPSSNIKNEKKDIRVEKKDTNPKKELNTTTPQPTAPKPKRLEDVEFEIKPADPEI